MESETVELHCKVCNKTLEYVRGKTRQKGMIYLQSGAYCDFCLPKIFEKDASVILFLIDAEWAMYSKRVELRGGKYYYAESRVRGSIGSPSANCWIQDETKHEIDYEEALSYAKSSRYRSAEDEENLKAIESLRKKLNPIL